MWPPLLVLLLRARRRWAPIVAIGATVVLAGAAFAAEAVSGEVSFILRACGLMAGSALALVLDRSSRSRSPFTVGRWAGLLGLGFLGLSVVRSSVEPFSWLEVGWLALPISVVLAVVAHRATQPLAAWLRSRTAARVRA